MSIFYPATETVFYILFISVTSDLIKRLWQHKNSFVDGFSKKYSVKQLVYYEAHENMLSAINRETRLKEWKRKWKLDLIEKVNPNWDHLYDEIIA